MHDRYGRTLAYLNKADAWDYSVEAARAGAARSYVYDDRPAQRAGEIQAAEEQARQAGAGLWGPPVLRARGGHPSSAVAHREFSDRRSTAVADTEFVSVGAVVQQVGEVLGRAHSLFGDPPSSGGSAAAGAGNKLSGAGDLVRSGQARISGLSGQFSTGYGVFAGGAGPALDGLAGTDDRLSGQLREAAGSDRTGRMASGSVVNGAAADTAGLAPLSNTPAGRRRCSRRCGRGWPSSSRWCRPTRRVTRGWPRCCVRWPMLAATASAAAA